MCPDSASQPQKKESVDCEVFRSFELDLLSYRFQAHPPFRSRCVTPPPRRMTIQYPNRYEAHSEGRTETFFCPAPEREARMPLSYTHFFESDIRVWHVTLIPPPGGCFTEFDLIKLTKFYTGREEDSDLPQKIGFRDDRRVKFHSLMEIPQRAFPGEFPPSMTITAGSAQIHTGSSCAPDSEKSWQESHSLLSVAKAGSEYLEEEQPKGLQKPCEIRLSFEEAESSESGKIINEKTPGAFPDFTDDDSMMWQMLHELISSSPRDTNANQRLEKQFSESERMTQTMKCLGGMVQGIFDFDRMSFDELMDILSPTFCSPNEIACFHRGALTTLERKSDLISSFWVSIGISPYDILPHALLLHNEALVDEAEKILGKVSRANPQTLENLDEIRQDAERFLNMQVPNVFQYPRERTLIEAAYRLRGSSEKEKAVRRSLDYLALQINSLRLERQEQAGLWLDIILGVIVALTSQSVIFALLEDLKLSFPRWPAFGLFLLIFTGGIVHFRLLKTLGATAPSRWEKRKKAAPGAEDHRAGEPRRES